MIELFPEGFEEIDGEGGVELAAYTDASGEERLWQAFGGARGADVEDGWEDRWRQFHKPVQVGPLWVGPPWEQPPAGAIAIVIEPARAFGTGAHGTTRLCLQALLDVSPGSLLDVGCGSGVLSVAAAKLGFAPVLGLDHEEPAVEATRANAELNGVVVEARVADATTEPLPRADVTVANIALAVVEQLRFDSDWLVTSGYFESERPDLPGFGHVRQLTADGWAADVYRRETG